MFLEICFPYDLSLMNFNLRYQISIFLGNYTLIRKMATNKEVTFIMLADPARIDPGDVKKCSKNKILAWQNYRCPGTWCPT